MTKSQPISGINSKWREERKELEFIRRKSIGLAWRVILLGRNEPKDPEFRPKRQDYGP